MRTVRCTGKEERTPHGPPPHLVHRAPRLALLEVGVELLREVIVHEDLFEFVRKRPGAFKIRTAIARMAISAACLWGFMAWHQSVLLMRVMAHTGGGRGGVSVHRALKSNVSGRGEISTGGLSTTGYSNSISLMRIEGQREPTYIPLWTHTT